MLCDLRREFMRYSRLHDNDALFSHVLGVSWLNSLQRDIVNFIRNLRNHRLDLITRTVPPRL